MLINADCLKVLPTLPPESVDLIVTDPPYKTTQRGTCSMTGFMSSKNFSNGNGGFKYNTITLQDYVPLLFRVLKPLGHFYIFTNNKNLPEFLHYLPAVSQFHYIKTLTWVKNTLIPTQFYMSKTEFIILCRKGPARKINNCSTPDALEYDNPKNKIHPSEKPIDLLTTLILNSSNPGDTVLDPFMGSGTTGVAALGTERAFIGIEKDPEFYKIAKERIA